MDSTFARRTVGRHFGPWTNLKTNVPWIRPMGCDREGRSGSPGKRNPYLGKWRLDLTGTGGSSHSIDRGRWAFDWTVRDWQSLDLSSRPTPSRSFGTCRPGLITRPLLHHPSRRISFSTNSKTLG